MACYCRLTYPKIYGNNLLKLGVEANLRLISAYNPAHRMDLKVLEGIIRTT